MPPRMHLNKTMSDASFYPAQGEIFMDEHGRVRIGDGIHNYQELPYVGTADFDIELNARTFIEQHVDLIEQNRFNELLNLVPPHLYLEVIGILLDCDINIYEGVSA